MKWIQALKAWNSQSSTLEAPHVNLWAIPKKGTPSYEEVKDIQKPDYQMRKAIKDLRKVEEETKRRNEKRKKEAEDVKARRQLAEMAKPKPKPKEEKKTMTIKIEEPKTPRDKFYENLLTLLNAKSNKSALAKFKKENPDFETERIYKLTASQKIGDFYPTPERCINFRPIKFCIQHSSNILEVGAGMGNIANFVDKTKHKDTNLTLLELNGDFATFLKEQFPNATIINENFFDASFVNNTYDMVISNPPFDKGLYLDFLIRCLFILSLSKATRREKCLVFVCPRLVKDKDVSGTWEHYAKTEDQQTFEFHDVVKEMGFTKFSRIMESIQLPVTKKEFQEYLDGEEVENISVIEPYQSAYVHTCEGFGGTNVKADVYQFIVF